MWFFTREGRAAKQQADDEIAADAGKVYPSAKAMFAHHGTLGAADSDADL